MDHLACVRADGCAQCSASVAGIESSLRAVLSHRSIPVLLSAPVLVACGGCAGLAAHTRGPQADPCTAQVIVAFSQDQGSRPSDRLVQEVARAEGVRLTFVRTIGPGLYAFSLSAGESDCRDALERLRRDSRVRSVDVDQRRGIS